MKAVKLYTAEPEESAGLKSHTKFMLVGRSRQAVNFGLCC